MTYRIAGTELDPQPTTGRWISRAKRGEDGNGRPIYEPTRRFEMKWGLLDPTLYDNLQDDFLSIGATGSLVVDLPIYTSGSYAFQSYTGCFVHEPQTGPFFTGYYQNVTVLVSNIITEK
jgi:hypothetical protein